MQMKVVIDQNCFRSSELVAYLAGAENQAVITDTAMYEMLKGADPVYAAKLSLSTLSKCPDQVITTGAAGALMLREFNTGIPITDPIDKIQTEQVRQLLTEIAAAAAGAPFPFDRAIVQARLATAMSQRRNHVFNKRALVKGVYAIKSLVSEDIRNDVKAGKMTKKVHEFISETGFHTLKKIAASFPLTDQKIDRLYSEFSLSARYIMVYLLSQLGWFETGGSESMHDHDATNDLHDVDYIVLGSYFDGVLSREKRVNRICKNFQKFREQSFDS